MQNNHAIGFLALDMTGCIFFLIGAAAIYKLEELLSRVFF